MEHILKLIEEARREGKLCNEAARLATVALGLGGDDAMLANRLVSQGADPASIEYLATGEVSEPIARAHRQGPGSLTGADKAKWLDLAALSANENSESTLRERVLLFVAALKHLGDGGAEERIAAKEQEIASLPFEVKTVLGREMRVYDGADLGFAAAYWAGEPCACVTGVYNGERYAAVGSNGTPLAELLPEGAPGKLLSPCFGIIEDPETLAGLD